MFLILNLFAPVLNLISRIAGRGDTYVIFHGKPAVGRYQVIPGKTE